MIKLAVFDMDGTILDTIDDMTDSVNHCLTAHGYEKKSVENIRSYIGNGSYMLIKRALPADCDEVDVIHEEYVGYYAKHCNIKTRPYDGIPKLMRDLKEGGIKIAIWSNKSDMTVQKLAKMHFDGLYDVAYGAVEGLKRKPEPDVMRLIMKQCSVLCDETVLIGDSKVDYDSAINAGTGCILVSWGFGDPKTLKELPVNMVTRADEILSFLKGENAYEK